MSTPNGYNNPAYCHQYDSSLYDYQYVPEIDPDSPDLDEESNRRYNQTKLVHPSFASLQREFPESEEGSDESNGSIIIEECNNRRVTLICEKRSKTERNNDEFYEDGSFRGAYYQDISLESENGVEDENDESLSISHEKRSEGKKSLRHQRPLEPPTDQTSKIDNGRRINSNAARLGSTSSFKQSTTSVNNYGKQRYHRYEEIPSDEEYPPKDFTTSTSVHRYAEIVSDENGYPSLKQEFQVEKPWESNSFSSRLKENYPPRPASKPRAISPINYPKSYSTPQTPTRTYQTNHYSRELELTPSQLSPNSCGPILCSSSPKNSFEMAELSPPRSLDNSRYTSNDQTFFIHGASKRQPPIGASALNDLHEPYPKNGKCILPLNLQKFSTKSGKDRSHSVPNSPKRKIDSIHATSSPSKPCSDRKITHILHLKPVKSDQGKLKTNSRRQIYTENKANPARRNISNSFTDPPKESMASPKRECTRSPTMLTRSPYKPTTVEIIPPRTAVITPIFQRKNKEQNEMDFSPRRNFEKVSQAFQSTGNIFKNTREQIYSAEPDFQSAFIRDKLRSPARIKRNQSVPNFSQALAPQRGAFGRKSPEVSPPQENNKYSRNLDLQYSPTKPSEHLSPIDKSRISLIDQTRSSWSNADSDYQHQCSTCFIFAAIIHLVTAAATCAISFYLLSKVGRRYYLDFGLLAGFVNFILGLLGFRSYCWRWLPNRNYVSGFIGLAAFSVFTCAGLSYLVTARPMAGDPILDIMGGAICAVSVLTIVLALTGLTMSGCCKAPPPDNRVTDI